jgi:hypothetical protein
VLTETNYTSFQLVDISYPVRLPLLTTILGSVSRGLVVATSAQNR